MRHCRWLGLFITVQKPKSAKVFPAIELVGPPEEIVATLAGKGIGSVMIEGGATTAASFQRAGLVDRYVVYVAPAVLGGDDGMPVLAGPGAPTMAAITRGRLLDSRTIGQDVRITVEMGET